MERSKILIIDIETTSFNRSSGSIIEVGIVELDLSNGNITTLLDSLCRESNFNESHHNAWIFENSDITPEMVYDAPISDEVFELVQDIVYSHPIGITSFNRSFDAPYLASRGINFGILLPCLMLLCQKLIGGKNPSVEKAWDYFFPNEPFKEKHRGASDARMEAKICYELYKMGIFKI